MVDNAQGDIVIRVGECHRISISSGGSGFESVNITERVSMDFCGGDRDVFVLCVCFNEMHS